MLSSTHSLEQLEKIGMPVVTYKPFPRYEDRDAWSKVSPETAKIWLDLAESFLNWEWPAITAEMWLTLKTTGALKPHWDRFRERRTGLGALAIAECIEGKGRFVSQIVNGIIAICEETVWMSPLAMRDFDYDIPSPADHVVDLCSSETAALIAWIDYLLGQRLATVSPRLGGRIRDTLRERIVTPYLAHDHYWWMGFTDSRINNWNPWCNMNVIMCLLLTEDDPVVRAQCMHKVLRSLDRYVETYSPDGCCDEGPMYWGAACAGLYVCYELLKEASGGVIDGMSDPRVRLIGEYITKVFVEGEYFVSFADGDVHVPLDSAAYRFGKALGNPGMMALGARARRLVPSVNDWFRAYQNLMEIFTEAERAACPHQPPYPREAWLWHAGVMSARENEGTPKGFFVSAKAGHNLESHNHNDVGSFVVHADGKPVLIDLGTEEYQVKTFSPQRYEIWYTQSQYHNCPEVRGVLQHDGKEYRASEVECVQNENESTLSMELRDAYPAEAGIRSWKRAVSLTRGSSCTITVTDRFQLDTPTDQVVRYLMTTCKPALLPGQLLLPFEGGTVSLRFDPAQTQAKIEEIPITESRLRRNWGDMLYRIRLCELASVSAGERVLTIERGSV